MASEMTAQFPMSPSSRSVWAARERRSHPNPANSAACRGSVGRSRSSVPRRRGKRVVNAHSIAESTTLDMNGTTGAMP